MTFRLVNTLAIFLLLALVSCKKEAVWVPDEQYPTDPFFVQGSLVMDEEVTDFHWIVGVDSGIIATSYAGAADDERAFCRSHLGQVQFFSIETSSSDWQEQPSSGIGLQFMYPETINFSPRTSWTQDELLQILHLGEYALGTAPGEVSIFLNEQNSSGMPTPSPTPSYQNLPISGWSGQQPSSGSLVIESLEPYTWQSLGGQIHTGYVAEIVFSCPLVGFSGDLLGPASLEEVRGRFYFAYK